MLCAGLTYAGPAQGAEGSHFSSGSKSGDELILMKELDSVGDALKGLLGLCLCMCVYVCVCETVRERG